MPERGGSSGRGRCAWRSSRTGPGGNGGPKGVHVEGVGPLEEGLYVSTEWVEESRKSGKEFKVEEFFET